MVHTLQMQRSRSFREADLFKVFGPRLKGFSGFDAVISAHVPQVWHASTPEDRSCSLFNPVFPYASKDLFARSSIPRAPEHRRKSAHPARAAESVAEATSTDSSTSGLERLSAGHRSVSPRSADTCHRARSHPAAVHAQCHAVASAGIKKLPVKKLASKSATTAALSTKVCFVCGVSKTPMWRRVDNETYCNACGLKRKRAAIGR